MFCRFSVLTTAGRNRVVPVSLGCEDILLVFHFICSKVDQQEYRQSLQNVLHMSYLDRTIDHSCNDSQSESISVWSRQNNDHIGEIAKTAGNEGCCTVVCLVYCTLL